MQFFNCILEVFRQRGFLRFCQILELLRQCGICCVFVRFPSLPELQLKQNQNLITKCTMKIVNSVRMPCLLRGQTYNTTSRQPDGPVVRHPGSPTVRQSDILSTFNSYSMKIKYSPSQVVCTVKVRSVAKLALKDSYVVYITYNQFLFVKL